jgi:hypothetical protein
MSPQCTDLDVNTSFEVLTVLIMKSFIFWDIMPSTALKLTDLLEKHVTSFMVKQ